MSMVVAELEAVRDGRRRRLSSGQRGAGSGAGMLLRWGLATAPLRSQARLLDRGGQARLMQHPLAAGFWLTHVFAFRVSWAPS